MTRKFLVTIGLWFFAYVFRNVDMLFSFVENDVDLFLLLDKKQDIQWYVYDSGSYIFNILIFISLYYNITQEKVRQIFGLITLGEILNLIFYWLVYNNWNNELSIATVITGFIVTLKIVIQR